MRRVAVWPFLIACGLTSAQPLRWEAQYTQVYSQPPSTTSALGPGLQLQGAASIVSDAAFSLPGSQATMRLWNCGSVATVPTAVSLSANTNYVVEFQYRIVSYGTSDLVLAVSLAPPGEDSGKPHWIPAGNMVKGASSSGTFSFGAL